jgi:hypothetical protein
MSAGVIHLVLGARVGVGPIREIPLRAGLCRGAASASDDETTWRLCGRHCREPGCSGCVEEPLVVGHE